jgi:4-amino-4-deoxy-L-arabinose transferase-like glycosyltransferase
MSRTRNLSEFLITTPTLLGIVFISVFWGMAWLPLFDLDEGAFSEATRELINSGNWITTTLNGEPRYDKPILTYWFQAISVSLFGQNEFGFRLPSVLASIGWIFSVGVLAKCYFGDRASRITVFLLSVNILATIIFKTATADALLNCFLNTSFLLVYLYCKERSAYLLPWLGLSLGLGFLTKGPVAVILPATSALIALARVGEIKFWLRNVLNWRLIFVFLLVVIPWHVLVYEREGFDFFRGFYLYHNLGRFTQTMESHGGHPLYYVLLLPILFLPFLDQLGNVLKKLPGRLLEKSWQQTYLVSWFVMSFVLFSFSSTQLPHYLLYGLTPIFLWLAEECSCEFSSTHTNNRYLSLSLGFFLVLTLCLAPVLLSFFEDLAPYEAKLQSSLLASYTGLGTAPAFLLVLTAVGVLVAPQLNSLTKQIVLSLLAMFSLNFSLLPLYAQAQQLGVKNAGLKVIDLEESVVQFHINMPSFSVYSQQVVLETLPTLGQLVFTRIDRIKELQAVVLPHELDILVEQSGVLLLRVVEAKNEEEH